jgi:hypothetical protein
MGIALVHFWLRLAAPNALRQPSIFCGSPKAQGPREQNNPGRLEPVSLSFQLLIFSQLTVFFSHNKSANGTFNYLFLARWRTDLP